MTSIATAFAGKAADYENAWNQSPCSQVVALLHKVPDLTADAIEPVGTTTGEGWSVLHLRGLGRDFWQGVDIDAYVKDLRDEWDPR